jgi:hypothetical protein
MHAMQTETKQEKDFLCFGVLFLLVDEVGLERFPAPKPKACVSGFGAKGSRRTFVWWVCLAWLHSVSVLLLENTYLKLKQTPTSDRLFSRYLFGEKFLLLLFQRLGE